MASPGAIASSLKHYCWNPRKTDFFPSFEAEIELDHTVIRPFKPISGKLKLSTTTLVKFHGGIRVQLDANVKLRFQSKVDNRLSTNWAISSILQDAPEPDEGNYVLSPLRVQILGNEDDLDHLDQPCQMEPGSYAYPFTLHMPGQTLPAPFRSQFGSLQFYITAYMGSPHCYVQVAEALVNFGGFLDLTAIPSSDTLPSATSHLHDSIFSCKPLATFTLSLEKGGYTPGEVIPFTLTILNPKRKEVKRVEVSLVRKTIYNAQGAVKTTVLVLDTFHVDILEEGRGADNNEGEGTAEEPVISRGSSPTKSSNDLEEIMYMGSLNVPKPCVPSYSGNPIYTVTHVIQYEVKVGHHPALGKGCVELLIGTTKPSAAALVNRLESRRDSAPGGEGSFNPDPKMRPRSHSMCVRSSHRPVRSGRAYGELIHTLTPIHSSSKAHPPRTLSMMSVQDFEEEIQ